MTILAKDIAVDPELAVQALKGAPAFPGCFKMSTSLQPDIFLWWLLIAASNSETLNSFSMSPQSIKVAPIQSKQPLPNHDSTADGGVGTTSV